MLVQLEKELKMLDRHLEILRLVIEQQPIGIVNLANETGYPHHKVRYSLRILKEESLIEPSKQGAITTGQAATFVDSHEDQLADIIEQLDRMKLES